MPGSTTRFAFPYPLESEAANIGATDMQNLAAAIDAVIPGTTSGTLAARPAAGTVDRRYYATDIGLSFRDTGTGWAVEGIPIGGYLAWAGDNDLTPELVRADGRLIDKTTYSSFFNQFGHRFNGGVDPGANHVKIPDVLGRTVIGAGTGIGLSARTVGQTLGEETHTLAASESGTNSNGSTANINIGNAVTYGGVIGGHVNNFDRAQAGNGGAAGNNSSGYDLGGVALNARPADSAHNNMQPSAVATVLVRII